MRWKRAFSSVVPLFIFLCTTHAEGTRPVDSRARSKPEPTVVQPEGSNHGWTEAEQVKLKNPVDVSPEESERVRPPELLESSKISSTETSEKPEAVEKASGMSTILGDESSYFGPTEAEGQKLIRAMREAGDRDSVRTRVPVPRDPRSEDKSR